MGVGVPASAFTCKVQNEIFLLFFEPLFPHMVLAFFFL
jgi:hypothetical protein